MGGAQAAVDRGKSTIDHLSSLETHNIGEAIVTFNYEAHCNNLYDDQRRTRTERLWDFIKGAKSNPTFHGKNLHVAPAPEPSDVNWENFDVRGRRRHVRQAGAAAVLLLALGLGIALQVYSENMRQDLRVEMYDKKIKAAASGSKAPTFSDDAALQTLTIMSSTVIVLINILLTSVAKVLNDFQRFHTRTSYEASLMLKLTVVHVINSVIVPIATSRCTRREGDHGECLWYAPGGLIEEAFYLQCFNAFLPDLIAFADLDGRFKRRFLAPLARTQDMLDALMKPPEFILAEKYAAICKTVALAILYGPVLPVSYLIALVGMASTYWIDKWIALRRCQKPVRLKNESTVAVVYTMKALSVTQPVLAISAFYATAGAPHSSTSNLNLSRFRHGNHPT